eukprot:scaffold5992_cov158-Ochromonas_danica.AAC.2
MGNYLVRLLFTDLLPSDSSHTHSLLSVSQGVTDDDESVDNDTFDVRKIYWDRDGNLRHGE